MTMSESVGLPSIGEERQRQLAERLREVREYLGLSQQFVADHTGLSRVAISAIENGKRKVEALELEALAQLYRHPVTYFLTSETTALNEPATIRALAREARELTEHDRQEVLRFAQFLKSYGTTGQPSPASTRTTAPE